jgi:hypothetical protein
MVLCTTELRVISNEIASLASDEHISTYTVDESHVDGHVVDSLSYFR